MKASVKVTLRGEGGKEEVEVGFAFDLSDEDQASRFWALRELMKESATLTESRQNFFYQISRILKGIKGMGDAE